jgi:hypothetical protein
MPIKGNGDRALAVYIAETRLSGSQLQKFLVLPDKMTVAQLMSSGLEEDAETTGGVAHGVEATFAAVEPGQDAAVEPLKIGHPHAAAAGHDDEQDATVEADANNPHASAHQAHHAHHHGQQAAVRTTDSTEGGKTGRELATFQQSAGFSGSLSHVFLIGAPFAMIFTIFALTLWKQSGDLPVEPGPAELQELKAVSTTASVSV